jgi:hypothetical protein
MARHYNIKRLASLCTALNIVDLKTGWPSQCEVSGEGVPTPVTIWMGPIGLSHRGRDDVERRFQNPGSNRPIWIEGKSVPLLLGLWDWDPQMPSMPAVVASADPLRRSGRVTRFSIFVGLDSLVDAARTGWSEGYSSDGEWICCFTPDQLPRLVEKVGPSIEKFLVESSDSSTYFGANSRIAEVARLASEGLTLQAIGDELGVTRERVRQILQDRLPELAQRRKALVVARRQEHSRRAEGELQTDRLERLLFELDERGIDPDDVITALQRSRHLDRTAERFKMNPESVRLLYELTPASFQLVETGKKGASRFSDEKLIEYLRLCAQSLGVSQLSGNAYDDFARRQTLTPEVWPTMQTMMIRFGSWREACQIAGLSSGRPLQHYVQDFPPARCRAYVDEYVLEMLQLGSKPTFSSFCDWSKKNAGPSGATVRNRIGPWSEALATSLVRVDRGHSR